LSDQATVPAAADNTAPPASLIASLAQPDPSAAPPPAQAAPPQQEQPKPVTTGTWRDKLPEDLRGNPSLSKFETEEGLAKSYVNLERMLGGDRVPVPKDVDDKEAWDRFYAAAGRPEKPDDYKITRPEKLEAGVTIDEEGEQFLRSFAHSNGWNQRQLDNAYKAFYASKAKEMSAWHNMQKAQAEEGERALQRMGNPDEIKTLAKATIQQYFDSDTLAKFDHAGLGNDPAIVAVLAKIGKDLTGHQVLKSGATGEPVKTVDQLRVDAEAYRSTHATALYDKQHPEHQTHVKALEAMYRRMYPEQAA